MPLRRGYRAAFAVCEILFFLPFLSMYSMHGLNKMHLISRALHKEVVMQECLYRAIFFDM
jgi:hypothetical protein